MSIGTGDDVKWPEGPRHRFPGSRSNEEPDAEPLRRELRELVDLALADDLATSALVRWLGFDGEGGTSLRVAAAASGVPVVTLRELWKVVRRRLRGSGIRASVVARAVALVDARLPATVPRLADALREAGLARAPFDARGLVGAAKLLEMPTPFVVDAGAPPILTHAHTGAARNPVVLACWCALGGRRVASVADALANLGERTHRGTWRTLLLDLVDAAQELTWLDDARTRFAQAGWVDTVVQAIGVLMDERSDASLEDLAHALAAEPPSAEGWAIDDLRHIVVRVPGIEVDGGTVRRRPARASLDHEVSTNIELDARPEPRFGDVDETERRAALVEVLQLQPETTLQDLCNADGEVGRWLRSITIVELAFAGIEAGIRRRTVAVPSRTAPSALQEAVRSDPPSRSTPERGAASDWSGSASSLSICVASRARPASDLSGASDRVGSAPRSRQGAAEADASLEVARVLDAIRRGPPYGVSMKELEAELCLPRSRLRERLRLLEVRGVLVRNGLSRSTRYALPRAAKKPEDPAESTS